MARARLIAVFSVLLGAPCALAQPGPDGFDWVRVTSPNNPAYSGPDPNGYVTGRGSVPYEYNMSRTEVATAQWMDFFNAAMARPDPIPYLNDARIPTFWGAEIDPTYQGPGRRFRLRNVANAADLPAGGIDWRVGAYLCNWLTNDRSLDRAAFLTGAYDTSTFGYSSPGVFTDQAVHSPGARYWIPTLDEWVKAVHFDPSRYGPGLPGWWQYCYGSDTAPIYGPPPGFPFGDPANQANAGYQLPGRAELLIPLGAYRHVAQTPWGLLDAAGGTLEWLEDIRVIGGQMYRANDGSVRSIDSGALDRITSVSAGSPDIADTLFGLRLSSSVPTPGGFVVCSLAVIGCVTRRRRGGSHDEARVDHHGHVRVRHGLGGGGRRSVIRGSLSRSTAARRPITTPQSRSSSRICRAPPSASRSMQFPRR